MKNIITITNLDSVYANENNLYKYNDLYIKVWRTKNDINGNPVYRLQIFDTEYSSNITENYKGKGYNFYKSGEFLRLKSYNLSNTIGYILK
ncbi:hypothetical protein UT300012_32480 [Paraclostridium bifermentans]